MELEDIWVKSIKTRLENYSEATKNIKVKKKHDIMKIINPKQNFTAPTLFLRIKIKTCFTISL